VVVIGPGAGRAIADMAAGAPPPAFDMTPFRLGRFFDGTRLKAGQAI